MNLHDFFEEHGEEFLKFDRVEDKLTTRPDLHAFLLLDKLFPGTSNMVAGAGHDEIYLDLDADELAEIATESQLIELHRCGVLYSSDGDSLGMFV